MPSPYEKRSGIDPGIGRNQPIDALRGIAVLSVLITHQIVPYSLLRTVFFFLPPWTLSYLVDNSYFGVVMFFTISGYLITSNILKRHQSLGHLNLQEFYLYRFARIVPPLALLIAVATLLFLARWPEFFPARHGLYGEAVKSIVLLRYNSFYFVGNVPGLLAFSPLWSLSIEEMFYLLYPAVALLLRREWLIALLLVGLVVNGPLERNQFVDGLSWWGCADLLALGCLTALLCVRARLRLDEHAGLQVVLVFAGLALIAAFFLGDSSRATFKAGPSVVAFGAALVLCAVHRTRRRILLLMPLAFLGHASYELYLFHRAIRKIYEHLFALSRTADSYVLLALVILIGFVIAHYFSEPLNRTIRRFYGPQTVPDKPLS